MSSEYDAKIKSHANAIIEIRQTTGAFSNNMMFALLALELSRKSITQKDLQVIMAVEKEASANTLKSYFEQNYGSENFDINNESEINDIQAELDKIVDKMFDNIVSVSKELKNIEQEVSGTRKPRKLREKKPKEDKKLNVDIEIDTNKIINKKIKTEDTKESLDDELEITIDK